MNGELRSDGDVAQPPGRSVDGPRRVEHRVRRCSGKKMSRGRSAKRKDVRIAAPVERRRYQRENHADVEAVAESVGGVNRGDGNVEIQGELELHHVVLEVRNTHQMTRRLERRVAPGE